MLQVQPQTGQAARQPTPPAPRPTATPCPASTAPQITCPRWRTQPTTITNWTESTASTVTIATIWTSFRPPRPPPRPHWPTDTWVTWTACRPYRMSAPVGSMPRRNLRQSLSNLLSNSLIIISSHSLQCLSLWLSSQRLSQCNNRRLIIARPCQITLWILLITRAALNQRLW